MRGPAREKGESGRETGFGSGYCPSAIAAQTGPWEGAEAQDGMRTRTAGAGGCRGSIGIIDFSGRQNLQNLLPPRGALIFQIVDPLVQQVLQGVGRGILIGNGRRGH